MSTRAPWPRTRNPCVLGIRNYSTILPQRIIQIFVPPRKSNLHFLRVSRAYAHRVNDVIFELKLLRICGLTVLLVIMNTSSSAIQKSSHSCAIALYTRPVNFDERVLTLHGWDSNPRPSKAEGPHSAKSGQNKGTYNLHRNLNHVYKSHSSMVLSTWPSQAVEKEVNLSVTMIY